MRSSLATPPTFNVQLIEAATAANYIKQAAATAPSNHPPCELNTQLEIHIQIVCISAS